MGAWVAPRRGKTPARVLASTDVTHLGSSDTSFPRWGRRAVQLTEAASRLVRCALEHDFALAVAHPPIDSFVAMRSFAQANA